MALSNSIAEEELRKLEEAAIYFLSTMDAIKRKGDREEADRVYEAKEAMILESVKNDRHGSDEPLIIEGLVGRRWTERDSFGFIDEIYSELNRIGGWRTGQFREVAKDTIYREIANIVSEVLVTSSRRLRVKAEIEIQVELLFNEIVHVVHDHVMEFYIGYQRRHWVVGDEEANMCHVCRDCLYQSDPSVLSVIVTLECGHVYHVNCIKRRLQAKNICPNCSANVTCPLCYPNVLPITW